MVRIALGATLFLASEKGSRFGARRLYRRAPRFLDSLPDVFARQSLLCEILCEQKRRLGALRRAGMLASAILLRTVYCASAATACNKQRFRTPPLIKAKCISVTNAPPSGWRREFLSRQFGVSLEGRSRCARGARGVNSRVVVQVINLVEGPGAIAFAKQRRLR